MPSRVHTCPNPLHEFWKVERQVHVPKLKLPFPESCLGRAERLKDPR